LSILDTAAGVKTLSDREIAMGLLEDAKVCATMLCAATMEAYTPAVRSLFENQLAKQLQEHKVVFDYMHKHGWYEPKKSPMDMAMEDLRLAKKVCD
jgi:spore coat protein CotF